MDENGCPWIVYQLERRMNTGFWPVYGCPGESMPIRLLSVLGAEGSEFESHRPDQKMKGR